MYRAATGEGMKKLLAPLDTDIYWRFKLLATKQRRTLEATMRAAIEEYIERHDESGELF